MRVEAPRWRAGWDGRQTEMPMTSSYGYPLPGIKEAKLLIKRLLSKYAIKTNYQVHLTFPSLGFLIW